MLGVLSENLFSSLLSSCESRGGAERMSHIMLQGWYEGSARSAGPEKNWQVFHRCSTGEKTELATLERQQTNRVEEYCHDRDEMFNCRYH